MDARAVLEAGGVSGVGLGFRLGLAEAMLGASSSHARFVEICPENYAGLGGRRARLLDSARERWPVVAHGLCGDLAGAAPIREDVIGEVGALLSRLGARWYSDHLCFTHLAGAEIHELVPLPFTERAAKRAARRVKEIQARLGLPMGVENVSAYARMPGGEMDEPDFVRMVAEEADCLMLLDVNNVYVNSVNFGFDPKEYIAKLPLERVVQIHVAGHEVEEPGLLLDTHAEPIIDPVYDLLAWTLERLPALPPVLLERDGNFPPLAELEAELGRLAQLVEREQLRRARLAAARPVDLSGAEVPRGGA
jgi:uncharacterized protein (UPF0276 family)